MGLFGKQDKRTRREGKNDKNNKNDFAESREEKHTPATGKAENEEDLLNNFLAKIGSTSQSAAIQGSGEVPGQFPEPRPGELVEIEIPPAVEEKIIELQKITAAIEKKEPVTIDLTRTDFSKYHVPYSTTLNAAQLAAVMTTDKPVMVIAGAGSGKTRVIVHRVSWLIENGVEPQSILLLTFTRKAAKEMLGRVEMLLQDASAGKVTGGTFHSFAAYTLRKYANLLNLPPNFTIIDTGDSEDVIDLIRTEQKLNT